MKNKISEFVKFHNDTMYPLNYPYYLKEKDNRLEVYMHVPTDESSKMIHICTVVGDDPVESFKDIIFSQQLKETIGYEG